MSKIGNREIAQMFLGGVEVAEAYLGSTLVFSLSGASSHYRVFGSPTISGTVCTIDSGTNNYIYTDRPFDPGTSGWTIQTRVKVNTAIAWRDIVASVDSAGTRQYSIVCQTNTNNSNQGYGLHLSNNGSSWNIAANDPGGVMTTGVWRTFQIVCTRSGNNYLYKMGYPEPEFNSWTSTITKTDHPTFGNYISFGGGWQNIGGDMEFDLSETKIWIGNDLWWSAL